MRIRYDAELDALSITFHDTTVAPRDLGDGIAADFDEQGRLASLEILDATRRLGETDTLRKVTLENVGLTTGH